MKTDALEDHEDDERLFIEALRQLAAETEPSPDFCARVLHTARQSLSPSQSDLERSLAQSHTQTQRSWATRLISTTEGALAAVLLLSIALNVWLAYQAREAAQGRQALVATQEHLHKSQAESRQWQERYAEARRTLATAQEQLQRATASPRTASPHLAQQTPHPPLPDTFTDLRGRPYTTIELAQVLFPEATSLGFPRSLTPRQPASSTTAVVLPLTFAPQSATILPQYYEDLEKLGSVLTLPRYADYRVRIDGHADSLEVEQAGYELAQERAENVKRYLAQHFAIAPERLRVQGYGASQSRAPNTTPEGREQNRRIEVVNLGPARAAE